MSGLQTKGPVPAVAPSFSVVVPCYNAASTLAEVLEALLASDPPPEEIIVVDDGSVDGSSAIASRFPVRLVRHETNLGVSMARNRGAELVRSDLVIFVDSDIVVPPELFGRLVAYLLEHSELVGVSVLVDPLFHRGGFLTDYLNRRMHHGFSHLRVGVTTLCTSCAAIWGKVFAEVGGFDDAGTCAVNDEAVLGWRLAERGYRVGVPDGILVRHLKRMSLATWSSKFFHEGRQWVLLVLRHRRHSPATAKLALHVRRPANVVLLVLVLATGLAGLVLDFNALPALPGLALAFVAVNARYVAFMARGTSPFWVLGALLMIVFETVFHLAGIGAGLVFMGRWPRG